MVPACMVGLPLYYPVLPVYTFNLVPTLKEAGLGTCKAWVCWAATPLYRNFSNTFFLSNILILIFF